ncbi:MAG: hypothetical protein RRY96_00665, partial [Ruthenibacterium sp.]
NAINNAIKPFGTVKTVPYGGDLKIEPFNLRFADMPQQFAASPQNLYVILRNDEGVVPYSALL